MTQTCQNCKKEFQIEQEDLQFYERINVPPPTWCPECRMMRRMTFRNSRTFYFSSVQDLDSPVFSYFSNKFTSKVYSNKYWWSDKWDAIEYGKDYDFNKPFFEQFKDLNYEVPFCANYNTSSINSDYCGNVYGLKNCYMLFNSGYSENCLYGTDVLHSQFCIDISHIKNCSFSMELQDCEKCYQCFFSKNCKECTNIFFSENLINCNNCFGCINLKHKSYCIFNKQYSKDLYFKTIEEFKQGSYQNLITIKNKINALRLKYPFKYIHGIHNVNITGDYIDYSKNSKNCFISRDLENSAYSQFVLFGKSFNSYDITNAGGEMCYEIMGSIGYKSKFMWDSATKDLKEGLIGLTYCMRCFDSFNLFGCVGLRNKEYCILNKQYTKEEYESLVPKIIQHMNDMSYIDKKGRIYKYGEFFPSELSPFCYNETIAQEYFPKTKEEAISEGYNWKEPEEKNIIPDIKTEDLPDNIKDVDESIIGKIIQCEHSKIKEDGTLDPTCNEMCTRGFKIIKQELDFYKRMNLPIPRLCPNCRHFQRLKQRNPLKLWHRKCECQGTHGQNPNNPNTYQNQTIHFHQNNPCPNEFETSYPPESPAIVYCEECYNKEVV